MNKNKVNSKFYSINRIAFINRWRMKDEKQIMKIEFKCKVAMYRVTTKKRSKRKGKEEEEEGEREGEGEAKREKDQQRIWTWINSGWVEREINRQSGSDQRRRRRRRNRGSDREKVQQPPACTDRCSVPVVVVMANSVSTKCRQQ